MKEVLAKITEKDSYIAVTGPIIWLILPLIKNKHEQHFYTAKSFAFCIL